VKLAEPYTFFVDRSLGGAFVAGALREAGHAVIAHDDEFEADARDVEWLHAVGKRGWVVLTKDARIRTNAIERGTLLSSKVAAFMLGREVAHRAGIHWPHWQKIESGEVNLTKEP
jgi:hypothetical protein